MAGRVDDLLVETIEGLLRDSCTPERVTAAEGGVDQALWDLLQESGLTLVGVPESAGGSGGTLHDMAAIIKAAGRNSAPVPLADTLIAAQLLARSGQQVPAGALALAVQRPGFPHVRSPWSGLGSTVVVSEAGIGLLGADVAVSKTGVNYPGEPWQQFESASLGADAGSAPSGSVSAEFGFAFAALGRALLIAGALQETVDLSIQYANEREQFGKPIGKFQILQHYLSEMAGESAATESACDNAIDLIASGAPEDDCIVVCGAAKAYAGRAVSTITRLAHQLHGAIGYTDEHRLQLSTRRLWAWRDEFGSEAEWAAVVGRSVAAQGGSALWPRITQWPPAGD